MALLIEQPPGQADLLRRMIADRLQEEAFGTLDRATLKLLDGFARRARISPRSAQRSAPACVNPNLCDFSKR
jgi:hypothetical protein